MKTEPWFSKTETLLKFLWVSKDRILRLEIMEKRLMESTFCLESSLNDFKRIPGLTAQYSLVRGKTRRGDYDYSMLMEEYETQLEMLTRQLLQKYRRLVSIRYRLQFLREQLAPIEAAIGRLSAEEQLIIEQKFGLRNSNYHTASLLHCSEKRVRYLYEKIIGQVARYIGKIGDDNQRLGVSSVQAVAW